MKYKILHNPRCGKSRSGLKLLEEKGVDFEIIKYLESPMTREEILNLGEMMGKNPIEYCRTGEKIFKELGLTKQSKDEDIISAMIENPKLIERPILIFGKKAVLGRPDPIEEFEKFI